MRVLSRDVGDDRVAVKDDVKLLAQMVCESITHIVTEDSNTLVKYLGSFAIKARHPRRPLFWRKALISPGSMGVKSTSLTSSTPGALP